MEDRKITKESERRNATVLFADISGFTAMSEKMDPEEVTTVMNNCFRLMEEVIKKYGGTIDKFIGDCVMALFGVPVAIENAPQSAINAAIELRNQLYQFNKKQKLTYPLDIHIGINTGIVLAGEIGGKEKKDYTVMGDNVNLASRLEDASEKGQILVGPTTYKATKDDFDYKALKPISLKGKEEPVEIYELLNISEKVFRDEAHLAHRINSQMVGRKKELNSLEIEILKTINGQGSIVNIIGEAGIGKSRLIKELYHSDVIKRLSVLKGRAISMGRNFSFYPFINLLKRWADISEDDTDSVAIDKLFEKIRSVDHDDVNEILPFVATLMGIKVTDRYQDRLKGIDSEAMEKLILKNLRDLLIKISEISPLLIVMEDLHWADDSSLQLLETLFRLTHSYPITIINVFRPDYQHTGEKIRNVLNQLHSDNYHEIVLSPLSEKQSEELIGNLLNIKGLPPVVRKQIMERASGNPFFIEEVVRSFLDEGIVTRKNGGLYVTSKIKDVIIPHTIQDVLMARIDRLDDKTRNLVKVASVIGRSFFFKILSDVVLTMDYSNDLEKELDSLKKMELILERKRMEELEYFFKHVLTQETTYTSMLKKTRESLHLKVADSIERVFNERIHEFYGMLAYHYNFGDPQKAEEYLIKAGEEALKSSASSEALNYYQQALNLYVDRNRENADPQKVAMLEQNIAYALFNRGRYVEAIKYFDEALSYYGETKPKNVIVSLIKFALFFIDLHVSLFLPTIKWKRKPNQADLEKIYMYSKNISAYVHIDQRKMFFESFYFARSITPFDLSKVENGVGLVASMSFYFSWTGISLNLSRAILRHIKKYISEKDIKSRLYYEFAALNHNLLVGSWKEIKPFEDALVTETLRLGEVWYPTAYLTLHARLTIEQGLFEQTKKYAENLAKIGADFENDFTRAITHRINTSLLFKFRKLSEFKTELEDATSFISKVGLSIILFYLYTVKAQMHILTKDLQSAQEVLDMAQDILAETSAAPYYLSDYLVTRFFLDVHLLENALNKGNKKQIEKLKREGLKNGQHAIRNAKKDAMDRTELYRIMGTFYWIGGKQKRALGWWHKSIKEGNRLGAELELSRTYFEIGKRLTEPFSKHTRLNNITAHEYLSMARKMFEEMDLGWDLDEFNKLGSRLKG